MLVVVGVLMASCRSVPAWGQAWRPERLWVAGSDESVWVVGSSAQSAEGLPVVQMWYAGKVDGASKPPRRNRYLPAVSGAPVLVGADADGLRVMFSDLTTRSYFGNRASMLVAPWREQSDERPQAWGGDASEATFWALVRTEALNVPTTQATGAEGESSGPATTQATGAEVESTGPGPTTNRVKLDDSDGPAEDAPWSVLRLRRGAWERLPVPEEASAGVRFWLSGRGGELYLFWEEPGPGVLTATWSGDGWTSAQVVTTRGDVKAGWAGAWREGPVFVAGIGEAADRVRLQLHLRGDGAWSDTAQGEGHARDGNEELWIDPAVCGVGIARGQLCVARPTEGGGVALGLGDLGVSPSVRFAAMPSGRAETPEAWSARETILLGVMLGLLMGVFWFRRAEATRPATLPPGYVVAAVWRRVVATAVDVGPAMLLSLPLFGAVLRDTPGAMDPNVLLDLMEDPEFRASLVPVNLAFVLMYGLWCLVWELTIHTTPGKRLLGCRVASSRGGDPTPWQIVARNAVRVVVFWLGPSGMLMALMTMLVVTRNRQRIGDLLAHTIVVEPGEVARGGTPGGEGNRPPGPPE